MLPIWAIRPDCLDWLSDRWLEAPVASWRQRDSVATVQVAIKSISKILVLDLIFSSY